LRESGPQPDLYMSFSVRLTGHHCAVQFTSAFKLANYQSASVIVRLYVILDIYRRTLTSGSLCDWRPPPGCLC